MTESGKMTEAKERWGILVNVALPDQRKLYRWSSGIDHVPYEFECSTAAEKIASMAYGDLDMDYRVYRIRDHIGEFNYESKFCKNNGDLH